MRAHRPGMEIVRIIGEENSPKIEEARSLLVRNGIPHGFYPATSEQGQTLLHQVGQTGDQLPVFTFLDGHALIDPTYKEVSDELGANDSADELFGAAIGGGWPASLCAGG